MFKFSFVYLEGFLFHGDQVAMCNELKTSRVMVQKNYRFGIDI